MARPGPEANLDRGSYDPSQDIETRQSIPARPVRAGSLGRAGQGEASQRVTGSSFGSRPPRSGFITTCRRSRSLTSSRVSPGVFSPVIEPSRLASYKPRDHKYPSYLRAGPWAQRRFLVARWVRIVSAAWRVSSVSSVGSSANGSSADAYSHSTAYGCATVNTAAIDACVMNASAANANAPTAICERIG